MQSRIFRRKDGTYTMNEYEDSIQNFSVIPAKYSPDDRLKELRVRAREV